jgi:hypothetical protein
MQSSNVIETHSQKTGFRRIELVQDTLQNADQYGQGTTFYFRVNGVPIFAGGWSSGPRKCCTWPYYKQARTGSLPITF